MPFDADGLFSAEPDKRVIAAASGADLRDMLCGLLFRRHVRPASVDPELRDRITRYVGERVAAGDPIRIVNLYGGFKGARATGAPHLNWSEVFHLSFMARWLVNLTALYEPGVILEYSGNAQVASYVDNYRLSDVSVYLREFDELTTLLRTRLPANFVLATRNVDAFYDLDKLRATIRSFASEPPTAIHEGLITRALPHARNNFVLDGEEDLSRLSPAEQESRIRESVLKAHAWYDYDLEQRASYFSSCILITNGLGFSGAYRVRSMAGTDKSFWMTDGILSRGRNGGHPVIRMPDDPALAGARLVEALGAVAAVSPTLSHIPVRDEQNHMERGD